MISAVLAVPVIASGGAGGKRFRAVPDRYVALRSFALSPGQWEELQIPVSMAFFFKNSVEDRVVAFYPSPAGATESLLPLDAGTFADEQDHRVNRRPAEVHRQRRGCELIVQLADLVDEQAADQRSEDGGYARRASPYAERSALLLAFERARQDGQRPGHEDGSRRTRGGEEQQDERAAGHPPRLAARPGPCGGVEAV